METNLVGKTVNEAKRILNKKGESLRVITEDGRDIPITLEYKPSRINVEVIDGVILKVLSKG